MLNCTNGMNILVMQHSFSLSLAENIGQMTPKRHPKMVFRSDTIFTEKKIRVIVFKFCKLTHENMFKGTSGTSSQVILRWMSQTSAHLLDWSSDLLMTVRWGLRRSISDNNVARVEDFFECNGKTHITLAIQAMVSLMAPHELFLNNVWSKRPTDHSWSKFWAVQQGVQDDNLCFLLPLCQGVVRKSDLNRWKMDYSVPLSKWADQSVLCFSHSSKRSRTQEGHRKKR